MQTHRLKNACFFGVQFWKHFGRVLERVWEAENLDFRSFFDEKSNAKKHDVLEGPREPSRRGKKRLPEALTP